MQNINSLKLNIVVIVVRSDGRDNTKKLWNFISIVVPEKKPWWSILISNNRKHMKSSKIEVDIVNDTDIWIMLLLLMIIKMMIMLLLVLLLLLLTTNERNNCNNYNYNNILIIEIIITIKMKSGCASKWKKIKSSYIYIIRLISYSVKKMLLYSMFVNFTNDYTPLWLWRLHDLVFSRLLFESVSDYRKTNEG